VVAGTAVLFGSDDGFIYAVNAKDGEELWKYEVGQPVQTSPCPAAGRLVMGADDGVIYCFRSAE
jgi:outer membrane protein assembly factor BamB